MVVAGQWYGYDGNEYKKNAASYLLHMIHNGDVINIVDKSEN